MLSLHSKRRSGLTEEDDFQWARQVYEYYLLQRLFRQWSFHSRALHPQPIRHGPAVYAVFKWISRYTDGNSKPLQHVFPYYAICDDMGQYKEFTISRVRQYVVGNILVPKTRLPLFLHTLAVLDAFQIKRIFGAWKSLTRSIRDLDLCARYNRLRSSLCKWRRWSWRRKLNIRRACYLQHRSTKSFVKRMFLNWKLEYKARSYEQHRLSYRGARTVLEKLQMIAAIRSYQRQQQMRGDVYLHKHRLGSVFHKWISRLCRISGSESLLTGEVSRLREWARCTAHSQCDLRHRRLSRCDAARVSSGFGNWRKLQVVLTERLHSRQGQRWLSTWVQHLYSYRIALVAWRRWRRSARRQSMVGAYLRTQLLMRKYPVCGENHDSGMCCARDFRKWRQLKRSLLFWRRLAGTNVCLRYYGDRVRRGQSSRSLSQCFGVWLVLAARAQSLRKNANRVLIDSLRRVQWTVFIAWRELWERAQLIRDNKRSLIALRNREQLQQLMQIASDHDIDGTAAPSAGARRGAVALRSWAMFVRQRRRAERVVTIAFKIDARSALRNALRLWVQHAHFAAIVTEIKKLWRGYRIRFLSVHSNRYRYLRWYRARCPLLVTARRSFAQRKVLRVLRAHHELLRQQLARKSQSLLLKRMLRLLRLNTSQHRLVHRRRNRKALRFVLDHRLSSIMHRWKVSAAARTIERQRFRQYRQQAVHEGFQRWQLLSRLRRSLRKSTWIGHRQLLFASLATMQHTTKSLSFQRKAKITAVSMRRRIQFHNALVRLLHNSQMRQRRRRKQERRLPEMQRRVLSLHLQLWNEYSSLRSDHRKQSRRHCRRQQLRNALQHWRAYRSNWSFVCRGEVEWQTLRDRLRYQSSDPFSHSELQAANSYLPRRGAFMPTTKSERGHYKSASATPAEVSFLHHRRFAVTRLRSALHQLRSISIDNRTRRERNNSRVREQERRRLRVGMRALFVNWRQSLLRERERERITGREHLRDRRAERRRLRHQQQQNLTVKATGTLVNQRCHTNETVRSFAQRKAHALLLSRVRRRLAKAFTLSNTDVLLTQALYFFDSWRVRAQRHFKSIRQLQKKRYQLLSFIIRRALLRWSYWARRSGKFNRQQKRARLMFARRAATRSLRLMLANMRRTKRIVYAITIRMRERKEFCGRRSALRRWCQFVQRIRRRRRAKNGFSFGLGSSTDQLGVHSGLRVVMRLKRRMQHFLHKLLHLSELRRQRERETLPIRQRPYNILRDKERDFLRLRLQRLHTVTQRKRVRRALLTVLSRAYRHRSVCRAIKIWKRRLYLTQRMRRTRRRLLLGPALSHWLSQLSFALTEHRACSLMHARMSRRVKRDVLFAWRSAAAVMGRLRACFDIVTLRGDQWQKSRALYAWSVVLDAKLLRDRAEAVQKRLRYKLLLNHFAHWENRSFVSRSLTIKNAQVCVQLWAAHLRLRQHIRDAYQRAERFADSLIATLALRRLYFNMKKVSFLHHSASKGYRLYRKRALHSFVNRWVAYLSQRRRSSLHRPLLLAAKGRLSLSITQRMRLRLCTRSASAQNDCLLFRLHRSLTHWLRTARNKRLRRLLRTKRTLFDSWSQFASGRNRLRMAFAHRISKVADSLRREFAFAVFKRRTQLNKNERRVMQQHGLATMRRLFVQWQSKQSRFLVAKDKVQSVISAIYESRVRDLFLTWKAVNIRDKLLSLIIRQRAMKRWKCAFLAVRYHRLLQLCECFGGWKKWRRARANREKVQHHRHAAMSRVMQRFNEVSRTRLVVAFHKWRVGDFSCKLSSMVQDYCDRETAIQRAKSFGDSDGLDTLVRDSLRMRQPFEGALLRLGTCVAGNALLFAGLQSLTGSILSTDHKLPRSIVVQQALYDRCMLEKEKSLRLFKQTESLCRARWKYNALVSDSRASVEEKLTSDAVPLSEKLQLALSARRPSTRFIGTNPLAEVVSGLGEEKSDHRQYSRAALRELL